jgi:gamma-glutamylcyclotransferase (GGCT)/AIG2-like uncharacterized protein YtfP
MDLDNLFVYGSLKPGGWSHHLLEGRVSNPRDGMVRGTMFGVGSFPAIRLDDENWVYGIVYTINNDTRHDLFGDLDRLEGVDSGLYARVPMPVLEYKPELVLTKAIVYYGVNPTLFNEEEKLEFGVWEV